MKKLLFFVLSILFFNVALSQNKALKITNLKTNKEKVIKENKRIQVKTFDGEKISGRFKLENNNIIINDTKINLADIEELKRDPLLTSLLTSGFLIYVGSVTAGLGVLIGVLVDSTAYWLVLPAAGMIYAGIKSPNINKNHKIEKGWKFEIINTSN